MLQHSNTEPILKEEQAENILAIYLEEEQINYIPKKDSGYTLDLEKSNCTNGVTISFDYNTWSVKTNYSNYENTDNTRVKCSLYFTNVLWKVWISMANVEYKYPTLSENLNDEFLMQTVFNNRNASEFLIMHPELIEEIKGDTNYILEADTGSYVTEPRSVLVKTIMETTGLSDFEKYENGLPFYLYSDGESIFPMVYGEHNDYEMEGTATFSHSFSPTLYLGMTSHPNNCARNWFVLSQNLDLSKYDFSYNYFSASGAENADTPRYVMGFGFDETIPSLIPTYRVLHSYYNYEGHSLHKIDKTAMAESGLDIRDLKPVVLLQRCENGSARESMNFNVKQWGFY